jgi:pimeloyl-ACP methyl ester carboxylesterase
MSEINYSVTDTRAEKTKNCGIIFIHGATGCGECWKFQKEGLSDFIKVITVNLPGHFCAEASERPVIDTYVTAVEKTLKNLELEKVILAGHSMGGAVVLSYYLKHPEKVDALILIGTGARLRVMPAIFTSIQSAYKEYVEYSGRLVFHKNTFKTKKELVEEVKGNMRQIAPHIAYSDYKICDEFDIMERLGDIKVPTLILVGDNDKLTPVKYSEYMRDRIKNSKLYIIENAGHMVMLEQGEQVNTLIKNFLERI